MFRVYYRYISIAQEALLLISINVCKCRDVMHSNGSEGACAAHLIRPVLAALDLGVLLQVGEHHDQLQALFPDHAPEVVHGCVGGALRADELLALLCLL
ncbi:unnamed protein product [Leptidea sinapis]|uniref:Uncharacterized protein n=1 Tax=Leptidea sinapis TaxID=189913 RepID=A0A5E4PTS9_9NEOP|nr:unnamed protein product [Leptidea sinapis]